MGAEGTFKGIFQPPILVLDEAPVVATSGFTSYSESLAEASFFLQVLLLWLSRG
ncbi:hypothetical protein A2U01_0101973, partial [Trifolium medium]|nr:hypothetical protein [Trifolium medium]